MCTYLEKFWQWSKLTPEEYAQNGMRQKNGEFEDSFLLFDEMIAYAYAMIDTSITDLSEIDDLLTILALDNEEECVLDYITEHSSKVQLDRIIARGLFHAQPNARWQIAELLSRRKPEKYLDFLQVLANDEHSVVRQRALHLIN